MLGAAKGLSRRFAWLIMGLGVLLVAVGVIWRINTPQDRRVSFADSARALSEHELPNENKPSSPDIAQHRTGELAPKKLLIPSLGIEARIISVGTDAKRVIQAPANIYDVGWIKSTAKPSDESGYMVVDGHVHGVKNDGVFVHLAQMRKDDVITIEQGNGTQVVFKVSGSKQIPYDEPAEKTLLSPPRLGTFELRLITCAGTYIPASKTFDKRVIVTAYRQDI